MLNSIQISEWLPNPAGPDAEGEWIELWNSGPESVPLQGWRLTDAAGRSFRLGGTLAPGERLVLRRGETRLVLRNQDEKLSLYDGTGALRDQVFFPGSVPEGLSLSRSGTEVVATEPSPGSEGLLALVGESGPGPGILRTGGPGGIEILSLSLLTGTLLALAVYLVVKRNHELSELFFGGNG